MFLHNGLNSYDIVAAWKDMSAARAPMGGASDGMNHKNSVTIWSAVFGKVRFAHPQYSVGVAFANSVYTPFSVWLS